MSVKILGLDWFDVLVHGVITVVAGVGADALFPGPSGDFAVGIVIAASITILGARRKRAMAALPPDTGSVRLAEIEDRMAEVDHLAQRVYELEERLEFTERLLARGREADQLRLPHE